MEQIWLLNKVVMLKKVKKRFILGPGPRVIVAIPCGVTEVEKKAVEDATKNAGAREVFLIEEPMAAAIGARLPVQDPNGNFIVCIGGGTTEVAVISLGGIVTSNSVRVAGDKIDLAISEYIKRKYNLAIGEQTAEEIKIKIGTAVPEKDELLFEMRGRDLITGLPRTIKISSNEVCEAISDKLLEIIQAIRDKAPATEFSPVKESPEQGLRDIASQFEEEAKEMDKAPDEYEQKKAEKAELEAQKLFHERKNEILNYVEQLKLAKKYEPCIAETDFIGVTLKGKKIITEALTPQLREGLEEELKKLGATHLELNLKASGTEGETKHKLELKGIQTPAKSKIGRANV
jgi:hypothetical protein